MKEASVIIWAFAFHGLCGRRPCFGMEEAQLGNPSKMRGSIYAPAWPAQFTDRRRNWPHPSKLTAAGLRGIFTGKESFSQAIARQSNGSAAGIALAEHLQRVG
jgi:hypothetical protein